MSALFYCPKARTVSSGLKPILPYRVGGGGAHKFISCGGDVNYTVSISLIDKQVYYLFVN